MEEKFDIILQGESTLDVDFIENENNFEVELANDTIIATNKDYNNLINKPSINNITLIGNTTSEDLSIPNSKVTNLEIDELF